MARVNPKTRSERVDTGLGTGMGTEGTPSGTLLDLDGYRDRRIVEGTWPPEDDAVHYWRGRLARSAPPPARPPAPEPTRRV
jgi:hypothetical protein